MAKKFYAVRVGRETGIFDSWDACKANTIGFKGAEFKSFPTLQEAEDYMNGGTKAKNETLTQETVTEGAVAYVDGSYHVVTREFSCGAVLFLNGEEIHFSKKFDDPKLSEMRNVAGEIKGSETVLQYCIDNNISEVTIYHDYEGVAKWATGEWKTNKEGTKAYRDFCLQASKHISFRFVKVKGHSGDKYNDLADRLAKDALGIE